MKMTLIHYHGQSVLGQIDTMQYTIKLLKNQSMNRKIKSLIHELTHRLYGADMDIIIWK